jgi:hypothetical protein
MEPNDMSEPQKAVSIEILDVHLDYMRKDIQTVLKNMSNMATTEDIKKLSERMDKFVTTDQFNALKEKVETSTIGSTVSRAMLMVQRVSVTTAAIVALVGMVVAIVNFFDKIKAVI